MQAHERFKTWRIAEGQHQAEVASRLGCSQTAVSQLERGVILPSLSRAIRIEKLTGIPVSAWADTPPPPPQEHGATPAGDEAPS